MCISTASRLALSVRCGVLKLLACCVFMVNSRINGLLRRSCCRRYCGDAGGILSKWSLHEDLADAMS